MAELPGINPTDIIDLVILSRDREAVARLLKGAMIWQIFTEQIIEDLSETTYKSLEMIMADVIRGQKDAHNRETMDRFDQFRHEVRTLYGDIKRADAEEKDQRSYGSTQ